MVADTGRDSSMKVFVYPNDFSPLCITGQEVISLRSPSGRRSQVIVREGEHSSGSCASGVTRSLKELTTPT